MAVEWNVVCFGYAVIRMANVKDGDVMYCLKS